MESEQPFLKSLRTAATKQKIKSYLFEASDRQIRLIQNLLIAFFDEKEGPIPLPKKKFEILKKSGKLGYIKKQFAPVKRLNSITEAKRQILHILPVLKVFIQNVVA